MRALRKRGHVDTCGQRVTVEHLRENNGCAKGWCSKPQKKGRGKYIRQKGCQNRMFINPLMPREGQGMFMGRKRTFY